MLLAFFSNEIRVYQQSVRFSMDIFHCGLEGIETARFWHLHFTGEIGNKIFHYYSIRSSKKSKNHENEVLLIHVELIEVFFVIAEVYLFRSPEGCYMLLVEIEEMCVSDGM